MRFFSHHGGTESTEKSFDFLTVFLLCALCASVASQTPPRKPLLIQRLAAGDLDGDGRAEVIAWDSESKQLVVTSLASDPPKKLTSHTLEHFPTIMKVADVDRDGRGELLVGEGLRGYNPKEGPQTDARLLLFRPLAKDGWTPQEIYRQVTERPQFTTLEVLDLDGDRRPEILFACFASKYQVDLRVARRQGRNWTVENLPRVRMGMSVAAGDVFAKGRPMILVGRPYGEELGAIGDAFILDGSERLPLPVYRGVSSLAVARLSAKEAPTVVAGDGWHQDYGRIARARIALLQFRRGRWEYNLLEDVPEHTRVRDLVLADLDGDGVKEIIAHGERRNSLGGDVRVYQRAASGWRAATVARNVQDFALGRFTSGKKQLQLVFTGDPPLAPWTLDAATLAWDPKLAPAVHTYKVDPAALLDKPAPALPTQEWLGGSPLSLEQLKGKVVLLDFWATWCKPCIAQFPKMRQWLETYGARGLVIIGVTDYSSQTRDDIVAFLDKHKLPWPVAIDPEKRTQMDYGVSPIPHTVLIDRAGMVRLSHVGGKELEQVEKRIESLLGEQP